MTGNKDKEEPSSATASVTASATSSVVDDAKAAATTTSTTATAVVDYKSTDRDVIVGDRTNTRLINRLLNDYVSLYHQMGYAKNTPLDMNAQQLVTLFREGLGGATFLHAEGFFVKILGASSTLATEADAIEFVKKLLEEEMAKPVQELEEEEKKVAPKESKESSDGEKEADAKESPNDSEEPTEYDVKVGSTLQQEDFASHKGNKRFKQILEKYTSPDEATIATSSASRVKAACLALRRTINATDSSKKARFVRLGEKGTWAVLPERAAAVFVIACVFDLLLQKDLPAAFAGGMDLKSLIPTIGTAEISQFADFSKPGTTPITETNEYDVLFGRGGMTNNHPGNKRFRDVISLHRPDYVRAIKIEKPNVARRIVAAIRGGNPPGRFLKRNSGDLMWYDVGNRHATEKTSQALREKSQAEKNGKIVSSASEGDVRKRLLEQALYEARVTRMRLSKECGGDNGCLDPETFKLLLPPQYMTINASGAGGKGDDPSSKDADSKLEGDAKDKKGDKGIRKLSLPLDLQDIKMSDANGVTGPSSSIGELDDNGDILVTENDILCGRGGLTNHHKGNKRFRDIVALHRPDYVRAAKVHKPAVARMIVKAIRNSDPPGRFLKKDSKTAKWFDIGDKRAAEKASQALREKTPEEREQSRDEPSDDGENDTNGSDKNDKGENKKATVNGDAMNGDSKKEAKDDDAMSVDSKKEATNGENEEAGTKSDVPDPDIKKESDSGVVLV